MRTSKPLNDANRSAELIEAGAPVVIVSQSGGPDLKVRSLKNINRSAYDAHLAEFEIDGKKARVNVEDVKGALRYV